MTNITIDRAVLEQVLEALTNCNSEHGHRCNRCDSEVDEGGKVASALRAALAQQDEPETCTWHQDGDSDSGVYATSCRRFFNLDDGTPEDNRLAWCCYCGRKLLQELITEDGDD